MKDWKRLLLGNKAWAQSKTESRRDYFADNKDVAQSPKILWISGVDGHVGLGDLTGVSLGELVVHRNVGNQVLATDPSMNATLGYALDQLSILNIVVCGHYACAAVKAAMTQQSLGPLNPWLRAIKDTYAAHRAELDLHAPEARLRRLVDLHVMQQVQNLTRSDLVQRSWATRQAPMLHGWVYDPTNGLLHPLVRVEPSSPVDESYKLVETPS